MTQTVWSSPQKEVEKAADLEHDKMQSRAYYSTDNAGFKRFGEK